MSQQSPNLTAPQAAELLGVSDQTIRDWARAGKLRAIVYPSGRIRIPRDHVEAILRGELVKADA